MNAQEISMKEESKSNPYYNQFEVLQNEYPNKSIAKKPKILNNNEMKKNEINREEKNIGLDKKKISQQILSSVKPNEEKIDDKKEKPKILKKSLNLKAAEYKPNQ